MEQSIAIQKTLAEMVGPPESRASFLMNRSEGRDIHYTRNLRFQSVFLSVRQSGAAPGVHMPTFMLAVNAPGSVLVRGSPMKL